MTKQSFEAPGPRDFISTEMQVNGPLLLWLEHDGDQTAYVRGIRGEPADFLRTRDLKRWRVRSPAWHWTAIDMDYRKNRLYLADGEDRYAGNVFILRKK